jgi:hypothetical protein
VGSGFGILGRLLILLVLDVGGWSIARSHLVHHFDVVAENGGDDRHHVGFHNSSSDTLGATHTNVHDTLESEAPFPHFHQIFASALLKDAHESLDAAIDGEDISNPGGGGCEVRKVVERVDER